MVNLGEAIWNLKAEIIIFIFNIIFILIFLKFNRYFYKKNKIINIGNQKIIANRYFFKIWKLFPKQNKVKIIKRIIINILLISLLALFIYWISYDLNYLIKEGSSAGKYNFEYTIIIITLIFAILTYGSFISFMIYSFYYDFIFKPKNIDINNYFEQFEIEIEKYQFKVIDYETNVEDLKFEIDVHNSKFLSSATNILNSQVDRINGIIHALQNNAFEKKAHKAFFVIHALKTLTFVSPFLKNEDLDVQKELKLKILGNQEKIILLFFKHLQKTLEIKKVIIE